MPDKTDSAQHLDWAEKAAVEHLRARLATGDTLLAQSNQLLALLLAGMSGALAVGAKVFEPNTSAIAWGAAAVSIWLATVAVTLTLKAIATRPTQLLFNEPKNLYRAELAEAYSFAQMREFELQNIQARIDETRLRNLNVAWWLDRCRYAATATPLVFAIAAIAAARLS